MRLLLPLLLAPFAWAQEQALIDLGTELFRTNCATPYCHGQNGEAGRAPKLIGHSLTRARLLEVVRDGIPGKGMPGLKEQLEPSWIDGIVAYVASLSSHAAAPAAKPKPRVLSAAAKSGRGLFFEAARTGACGTCHVADGWGIAIAPNPATPAVTNVAELLALQASHVVTAKPAAESAFPSYPAKQNADRVELYDLSTKLPVLRMFTPAQVTVTPGSNWSHARASGLYSAKELETILVFLRELR
ncbi:MAG: cytochrome c [Acidobacteriia bacterium]|nr:cytochrome c [Terriglobia bacterium]